MSMPKRDYAVGDLVRFADDCAKEVAGRVFKILSPGETEMDMDKAGKLKGPLRSRCIFYELGHGEGNEAGFYGNQNVLLPADPAYLRFLARAKADITKPKLRGPEGPPGPFDPPAAKRKPAKRRSGSAS